MKEILIGGFGLILSGCVHQVPIVRDIRPESDGSVLIERCLLKHSFLTGKIEATACHTEKLSADQPAHTD